MSDSKRLTSKPKGAVRPTSAVDRFLRDVAVTPAPGETRGRGRMIFAMDATASREPTWDKACELQGEMFEAAAGLGGLAVQLAYYRGFREFQTSAWLRDSRSLVTEMTGVRCRGGHTQIARLLDHALKEARTEPVGALVFVGDSVEENPDTLCELAGELGLLGLKAFMFLEGRDPLAESTFREIARLTGGACVPFDSNSADQLRDLLGAVASYVAGGRVALERYGQGKSASVLRLTRQIK